MVIIKKRLYFLSLLATVVIFSSVPLVSIEDPEVQSALSAIMARRAQRRLVEQDQRAQEAKRIQEFILKLKLLRQSLREQGLTEQEIEEEMLELDPQGLSRETSQPMITSVVPQDLPYADQGSAADDLMGNVTKLGRDLAIQTAIGVASAPIMNAANTAASYAFEKGWDATKIGVGYAGSGALKAGGTVVSGLGSAGGALLPSVSFAIPQSTVGKVGLAAGAAGSLAAWYLFNKYRKDKERALKEKEEADRDELEV